jgi:N-acetylglucosamine kinase-like BadF-type ATPase
MSFLLGIDGGGSKSAVTISDGVSVLATHTAGGCNLTSVSKEQARIALGEAVQGALSAAGISARDIDSVCAGVAGGAAPEVAANITQILAGLLPLAAIQVVGDTAIALEAAFAGEPGMICIAGTGSVAYGRNQRGEVARAGGWGRIVSDEGSGHWIGMHAVSQCLRALDMGRSSQLITGIMEYWGIVTREQLVQRCHREQPPNFAELFPVVLAIAEAGDPLASELLTAAGFELARIAQIVLRRLWIGPQILQIAVSGSVFANSPRICQAFSNIIRAERPEVQVRLADRPSIEGALHMASRILPSVSQSRAVSQPAAAPGATAATATEYRWRQRPAG